MGGELGPVTVGVEQRWLHGCWHVAMRPGLVGPMLMPWTLTLQGGVQRQLATMMAW